MALITVTPIIIPLYVRTCNAICDDWIYLGLSYPLMHLLRTDVETVRIVLLYFEKTVFNFYGREKKLFFEIYFCNTLMCRDVLACHLDLLGNVP